MTSFTSAEQSRYVTNLSARLANEGWTVSDPVLRALAGVLPSDQGMPEASVVAGSEGAFVLRDSLMVASWEGDDEFLTTDLLSLAGRPLSVVWNADWLAEYDSGEQVDVPEVRPVTVTMRGPRGVVYVLPFDAAWTNPFGCINFATTLIQKAHGFRPSIGTAQDPNAVRTWKR